jgi:4-hydroxybenzoate polyprenyltransferase
MTLLLAYARERLTASRLVPAVLLLILATIAGRGWDGGEAFAIEIAAAFALVVTFRIWDDLADRERDRGSHPTRVTVTATSIVPLQVAGIAAGAAAVLLLGVFQGWISVAFVTFYGAVLAASYAGRRGRSATHERILLLKYGVFALALIGLPDASARGLLAAAAAFVAACVYEWWHDAESPVFSFGGSR